MVVLGSQVFVGVRFILSVFQDHRFFVLVGVLACLFASVCFESLLACLLAFCGVLGSKSFEVWVLNFTGS